MADRKNPLSQRSLLEHNIESLRIALAKVDQEDVRGVLRTMLAEREEMLRDCPAEPTG